MPVPRDGGKARSRAKPRAQLATLAAVVAIAAAGYWWLNRPQADYKRDNSDLYPINVEGKVGFMDHSGRTVIKPQFDGTSGFSEGLADVRVGTKVGYINTKGTVVIAPQFDSGGLFTNGRAAVQFTNRFGAIDADGKLISSPTFQWVGSFTGNGKLAPVRTGDNQAAFIDRSGTLVWPGKFDALGVGFTEGLAPAASGGKWGYIDEKGTWVIDPQFEWASNFRDGLASVKVGGRTGYIDRKGKFVINPQFEWGEVFFEGRARVKSGDGQGFIDTKGATVGDTKFSEALPFSDGLAAVKTDDGWGYIDTTGKMVVSPQFDSAASFLNGLALVWIGGRQAYVRKTGALVADPFAGRAGIPAQPVREIWEGNIGGPGEDRASVRFLLIREGAQIRGYYWPTTAGQPSAPSNVKGEAARDGSFSMTTENGPSWKAQFASAVLIKGTLQVRSPGASAGGSPIAMQLRLVRDASDEEVRQAEAGHAAGVAKVANRSRVEQGIVGAWKGSFDGKECVLTISRDGDSIQAVLLNGSWRETLRGQLLDDGTLVLTGTGATQVGPGPPGYSLDSFRVELNPDGGSLRGQNRDAVGRVGSVEMQRASATSAVDSRGGLRQAIERLYEVSGIHNGVLLKPRVVRAGVHEIEVSGDFIMVNGARVTPEAVREWLRDAGGSQVLQLLELSPTDRQALFGLRRDVAVTSSSSGQRSAAAESAGAKSRFQGSRGSIQGA